MLHRLCSFCANVDRTFVIFQGPGIFTAPNGDVFYGTWDATTHKRHSLGLFCNKDGKEFSEMYGFYVSSWVCAVLRSRFWHLRSYEQGKLLKRVVRAAPVGGAVYWEQPARLVQV